MICPKCHSETHVVKTVKHDTVVLRVRVCDHCYFSFTTEEKKDEEKAEMVQN